MKEVSLLPPEPSSLSGGSVPAGVGQVLASRTFGKTPALRTLLEYLWRHRDFAISEYAIATEALGRAPSFDPRIDATVRVQISRLRQRLEKFYEEEGRYCPERLVIPLGSHRVELEVLPLMPAKNLNPPFFAAARFGPCRVSAWCWRWLPAFSAILLTLCVAETAVLYATRGATPAKPPQSAGWVWKQFFGNGRRTQIILPTPIFFSFKRSDQNPDATVMFRDTEVNEFSQGPVSSAYRVIEGQLGKPNLSESYTVTSDTFASVELVRYLDRAGLYFDNEQCGRSAGSAG